MCTVGGSVAMFIGEGSSMFPYVLFLSVAVQSICKETKFNIALGSRVLLA